MDVALFPRVFLPSATARVGAQHPSLLLPLWLEKDWGDWSSFGGGGCTINRGGGAQDFCQASWALTRQVLPDLQLGAEIVHQTADTKGGRAATGIGFGVAQQPHRDLPSAGLAGPGLQNAAETAVFVVRVFSLLHVLGGNGGGTCDVDMNSVILSKVLAVTLGSSGSSRSRRRRWGRPAATR